MKYDLSNHLDKNMADVYYEKLKSVGSKIELKKIGMKRSLSINSYLHVCITLFAIEFGYTLSEAKTLLKRECDFMTYEKNGIKFLVETSKQNNDECSLFVNWIRNYSSEQGLYIPDAEEYKENRFNIDREIDKHKTYL